MVVKGGGSVWWLRWLKAGTRLPGVKCLYGSVWMWNCNPCGLLQLCAQSVQCVESACIVLRWSLLCRWRSACVCCMTSGCHVTSQWQTCHLPSLTRENTIIKIQFEMEHEREIWQRCIRGGGWRRTYSNPLDPPVLCCLGAQSGL